MSMETGAELYALSVLLLRLQFAGWLLLCSQYQKEQLSFALLIVHALWIVVCHSLGQGFITELRVFALVPVGARRWPLHAHPTFGTYNRNRLFGE